MLTMGQDRIVGWLDRGWDSRGWWVVAAFVQHGVPFFFSDSNLAYSAVFKNFQTDLVSYYDNNNKHQ